MSSRIKIKMGPIEVEYEGSEEFLKEKLLGFLSDVLELYKSTGLPLSVEEVKTPPEEEVKEVPAKAAKIQWTTETLASKLKCSSGPDLILAACSHLIFVTGQKSFNRKEILKEMQTSEDYYKATFSGGNLTTNLQRLVKNGKLNKIAKGTYSLSKNTQTELRKKLGIS